MPMPPINVTPLPLFKTPDTSGFLELSTLVQALPQMSSTTAQPVNQNALVSVVKVLANESRELMVAGREAEIDKQVKLLSNPMSKRAVDHDLRLLDCVSNIKRVLVVGSGVMVAWTPSTGPWAWFSLPFKRWRTGAPQTRRSTWWLTNPTTAGNLWPA